MALGTALIRAKSLFFLNPHWPTGFMTLSMKGQHNIENQNKAPGPFQIQGIDLQLTHHSDWNRTTLQHRRGGLHTSVHRVAFPGLSGYLALCCASPDNGFRMQRKTTHKSTPLFLLPRDHVHIATELPGVRVWML